MPELPQRKIGIIACSGEEMAEGTVSRLAALKVLEQMRPGETVTICLPLFLAGGEGDRAFARFYPTIAVDGCEERCAYRGTEQYSNRPAASVVISEMVAARSMAKPAGLRRLDSAGIQAVETAAQEIAFHVDDLLAKTWDRRQGDFADRPSPGGEAQAETCACGSGIPVQHIQVAGKDETVVALPLIFANLKTQGKLATESTAQELLEMVKIYNPISSEDEPNFRSVLLHEYALFLRIL
jgi:hypothetical protein